MALTRSMALALVIGCGGVNSVPALAQNYPYKPVRILASEPGAQTDFTARLIAPVLTSALGQQVIVDNRPGLISVETAARALPDGYSLLMYTNAVWILPLIQKVSFDPGKDFAPLTLATNAPLFLFAHPALPAKTVKEVIALAKTKPGSLNYGSAAFGTTNHLAFELFNTMAAVNIVRIPYKGSGAAAVGLLANQVQLMFVSAPVGMSHVKAGRLRVIGAGTLKRSALAPDVPTVAESGLPGFEASSMGCMWLPSGTPRAIINRLNKEIVAILQQPETRDKLLATGIEAVGLTPEQTADYIKSDTAKWRKLVKTLDVRQE